MNRHEQKLLRHLASKYVWWKSPDEALRTPQRIAVQVMNIGDYDDVQRLANNLGDGYLRRVIANAAPGQLNGNYWHHRLGLVKRGRVPPMPKRKFG